MTPELRVQAQAQARNKEVVRLDVRGSLCAETMETLENEMERWLEDGFNAFLIYMEHLEEMSLAGAASFLGLLRRAQEEGGRVSLLRPSAAARQALELHGALSILHVVTSPEEFK